MPPPPTSFDFPLKYHLFLPESDHCSMHNLVLLINILCCFLAVATGFVVDAAQGLILTNRHVVSTGPMRAEATFTNKEEVDLVPIYRDPIHDFAFFRFDPSKVRHMTVTEIELAPDEAAVGSEIRVVGNDAGEKLSILSGVLARTDRNAPDYESDGYNDFNTFYYSAASNTSGGSSGSPVLNIAGRAIALNAGGATSAASSFYLPLHRVASALSNIQQGSPVPRGTDRVVWTHSTYDELKKLGLREETERRFRNHSDKTHPQTSGLLVVDQIIERSNESDKEADNKCVAGKKEDESPAWLTEAPPCLADGLDVGDILLAVNGTPCTHFVDLEAALDEAVGNSVLVMVERGGEELTFTVEVEDLHALTPSTFLEASGALLHDISFQQARNGNLEIGSGCYVASSGFSFDAGGVSQHTVITAVGGKRTRNLEEMRLALDRADEDTVAVRYFIIGDKNNENVAMVRLNHRWFRTRVYSRNDVTGLWDPVVFSTPPRSPTPAPSSVGFLLNRSENANKIIPSLCKVCFNVLHAIDGVAEWRFTGNGLVVCAERGIVVVDRNSVVSNLGEVTVTFPASTEVPGRVIFMHPIHNFAMIQYDPSRFEGGKIKSAVLCPQPLGVGDNLEFVGLCRANTDTAISQEVHVCEISAVNIPQANVPRFRAANEEIAKFDEVKMLPPCSLYHSQYRTLFFFDVV